MSKSRFTAQEMRDTLKRLFANMVVGVGEQDCFVNSNDVIAMLRQAADAENENARLRVDADLYKGEAENWERRAKAAEARLDEVVKNLEDMRKYCAFACVDTEDVDVIIRVARGEVGAEGGRSL